MKKLSLDESLDICLSVWLTIALFVVFLIVLYSAPTVVLLPAGIIALVFGSAWALHWWSNR